MKKTKERLKALRLVSLKKIKKKAKPAVKPVDVNEENIHNAETIEITKETATKKKKFVAENCGISLLTYMCICETI